MLWEEKKNEIAEKEPYLCNFRHFVYHKCWVHWAFSVCWQLNDKESSSKKLEEERD